VVIPHNYPEYTTRRVHVAQWIDGEKLSQSISGDVGSLVNLGVLVYLTQLLDTGFFHGAIDDEARLDWDDALPADFLEVQHFKSARAWHRASF